MPDSADELTRIAGTPIPLSALSRVAADAPPEARSAPESARFGKFIRVGRLGEGGMGEVWKAWDTALSRWVALKFPRGADGFDRDLFKREAELAGRLSHPHIAAVLEVGEANGLPYIAMPFVEGQTLKEFPPGDLRGLVGLIRDAARAIAYAHVHGVVHRDLKPANLMVTHGPGGILHVAVMDFGLARPTRVPKEESLTGGAAGTLGYMAPEQARTGEVDGRADIYSLGATMYERLTGRAPIVADSVYEYVRRIEAEDPPSPRALNPAVDRDLARIVLKCLEKEPSRRYETADRLAEDLDRWLDGEPVRARPIGPVGRFLRTARRNPRSLAFVGLILVASSIALAVVVRGAAEERKRSEARRAAAALLADAEVRAGRARTDFHRYGGGFDAFRGDLLAAADQARSAADRDPSFAAPWATLGACHVELGEFQAGRRAFAKAIEIDPHNAAARIGLADLALEDLSLLFSGSEWAGQLPVVFGARLVNRASEEVEALGDVSRDTDLTVLRNGLRLLAADDRLRAGKLFEEASATSPRPGRMLLYACVAYSKPGLDNKGENLARCAGKALELMPRDPAALYYRALAAILALDSSAAERDFNACLDRNPRYVHALVRRAWVRYASVHWADKWGIRQTNEENIAAWRAAIPAISADLASAKALDPDSIVIRIIDCQFRYIVAFRHYAADSSLDSSLFQNAYDAYATVLAALPEARFLYGELGGAHYFHAAAIAYKDPRPLAEKRKDMLAHLAESASFLLKARDTDPGPMRVYSVRTRLFEMEVLREAGEIDAETIARECEALRALCDEALKLDRTLVGAPRFKAECWVFQGDRAKAVEVIEAAMEDPNLDGKKEALLQYKEALLKEEK